MKKVQKCSKSVAQAGKKETKDEAESDLHFSTTLRLIIYNPKIHYPKDISSNYPRVYIDRHCKDFCVFDGIFSS